MKKDNHTRHKYPTLIWLFLMAATIASWLLIESSSKAYIDYFLITISAVKILLIGLFFMKVSAADIRIFRFYIAWLLGVSCLFASSVLLHS